MSNVKQKTCTSSGSLDGCDDDKTMSIKYGPCRGFLVRLRSQEDTDVDSFKEIPWLCGHKK